ncbi:hypothetical protein FH603_4936 [Spirosoma sp. LMG 31447]|uniref:Uncharacterized protein n=1 Tax=Spirosoma utsteinense TaxID=2585773 RepID=A0ABR6WCV8_9BACT|nr:hypothetical protein [Spirosoma utsteinense]
MDPTRIGPIARHRMKSRTYLFRVLTGKRLLLFSRSTMPH